VYAHQPTLFGDEEPAMATHSFPSTRYQGSKRKLAAWIWSHIKDLPFESALDVFGGTGCISYFLKDRGKEVTYNDNLLFNWHIGTALVENNAVQLSAEDIDAITMPHAELDYPSFIKENFRDIYFTDYENLWLDRTIFNIDRIVKDPTKRSMALFALFQACIIKRPYNLFHRANLYMRMADVKRGFGNKSTWDTPFDVHFRSFVRQVNQAVFDNARTNRSLNLDALETPTGADLVYIDPPYLNARGVGVDYHHFYHFLEGLAQYGHWPDKVDWKSKHKRLLTTESPWQRAGAILEAFDQLFFLHRRSMIVVSYRNNGIPSPDDLVDTLKRYKKHVSVAYQPQKYVLSDEQSSEILIVAY